jgi:nitrite reductase (cytochrome c-552)
VQYLTFPWDKGMNIDAIEKYYDNMEFTDWTHALSKAPMLKAQHPDYELFKMGIHGQRGVACADCHMPYMNQGGQKFTDHHVQSPLNNVANSCQVCHREETEQLIQDVYERQDKLIENKYKLEALIVRAHVEAKKAWDLGANQQKMDAALNDIRHAQWRWDFVAASHASSFHSPIESARIIASGIEIAQEARIKLSRILADLGHNTEIPYPDISTKQKAQEYIGLDMKKLNSEKEKFIETVIPQWLEKAKQREELYNTTQL